MGAEISEKGKLGAMDNLVFREVIGHFASGVTVITTKHEEVNYGVTASAVSSLSVDPPMLLVCINQATGTCNAISKAKVFGVNILHEDQGDIALQFARPSSNKFEGIEAVEGRLGEPILKDTLAHLECRVVQEVTGGTHSVFLAEVVHANSEERNPLTYYRGKFGRFVSQNDEMVYLDLRSKVLKRDFQLMEPFSVASLTETLDVPRQVIYHALTKLEADGLIKRSDNGDFSVTPLSIGMLTEALETRCALEVAAIEKTVGNISQEELSNLRKCVEETLADKDKGITDIDKYIEANISLHDYTIALTNNATLLDSYRRLTAEAVMTSALRVAFEANDSTAREELDKLTEDHAALLTAYENGDKEAAKAIVKQHTEEAKKLGKYIISHAGGSI
ncbi:flavin reductase [Sporosarcina newyorkensis]|uniref:NADH-FMN oxidoreductase RutF, flavin reductase (DIM6/NTAB) family n=2 Tax=Sporosarcina newyorkensis TaxID=759851 RepID=A0A1T4Y058_9BACL|nr:flavin reductase [Sporosarcina newyorkensis]EGQ26903.1 GntR family transcriptional regulator [Sporosarcina newyorkensis 2681]SKA95160.1 NADH-FMN oxidoreductase RutF, flavin reductase (DIM6/NTAB) family [Sporosarcina newyorkensis]